MNAIGSNHPNASVAALAGALTVVAVWIAKSFGLDVPAEVASALTTIIAAGILFAGRRDRAVASTS
jgi:hypothetical protein